MISMKVQTILFDRMGKLAGSSSSSRYDARKSSISFIYSSIFKLFKLIAVVVFIKYQIYHVPVMAARTRGLIYNRDGKFIFRSPKSNQGDIIVIDDRHKDPRPATQMLDSSYAKVSGLESTYQPYHILSPRIHPDSSTPTAALPLRGILTSSGHIQLISLNDFQPVVGPPSVKALGSYTGPINRIPLPTSTFHISNASPSSASNLQAYPSVPLPQQGTVQVLPVVQLYQPAASSAAIQSGGTKLIGASHLLPSTTSARLLRYDHVANQPNVSPMNDYSADLSGHQQLQHEFMNPEQVQGMNQHQSGHSSIYHRSPHPRVYEADALVEAYDSPQHHLHHQNSYLDPMQTGQHQSSFIDEVHQPAVSQPSRLSLKQQQLLLLHQHQQQRRLYNALIDFDHTEDSSQVYGRDTQGHLQNDRENSGDINQMPNTLETVANHHQQQQQENFNQRQTNPIIFDNIGMSGNKNKLIENVRTSLKLPISDSLNNTGKIAKKSKRDSIAKSIPSNKSSGNNIMNRQNVESRRFPIGAGNNGESLYQDESSTELGSTSKDLKNLQYWKQFKDQFDIIQ